MPGNETLARKLARTLLADHGVPVIWKLHADAATLHRIGNAVAAAAIVEIAEAAEMEWLQKSVGTENCRGEMRS